MAEQPVEQPDVVEVAEPTTNETSLVVQEQHESSGIPKGAIAFGVIMILGYILYFFMIWSEVIARGGQ